MNKTIAFLLMLFLSGECCISQNTLPDRNEFQSHKILEMVTSSYIVLNGQNKKEYTDTLKFDVHGNLIEKRITTYDTALQKELAGDWKYTYDSLGNRLLETRKALHNNTMDYFNYVYDSFRIKKKIWTYWVNLRHLFDRIYEYTYDKNGTLKLEIIENGSEKIDSVLSYNYDEHNRLIKTTCASDKKCKDTIYSVDYSYNTDNTLSKKTTIDKTSQLTETYTYNQNKHLVKAATGMSTSNYQYDAAGLLTDEEIFIEGDKVWMYTYAYISTRK